jgi:hypothetical protein
MRFAAAVAACKIRIVRSVRSCSLAQPVSAKPNGCKALAVVMFDDEHAMVRLDMSEFMERHTGEPPDRAHLPDMSAMKKVAN